jgi:hypothetical protein
MWVAISHAEASSKWPPLNCRKLSRVGQGTDIVYILVEWIRLVAQFGSKGINGGTSHDFFKIAQSACP